MVLAVAWVPTILVSESIAISRAVIKENKYVDLFDYMIPISFAKTRLNLFGMRNCTDVLEWEAEPHYLVNFLAAAHSEKSNDKALIKKYLITLKNNGCSFDSLDLAGLPPIHSSVVYNDLELVEFFVENNANISANVERPGKKPHGKNALEFAILLQEIEPDVNRKKIIEYLGEKI